jgi:SAM-dependent methyltransferase
MGPMIEQRAGAPIPSLAQVAAILARHLPFYGWHAPVYQTAMLRSLAKLWDTSHKSVLDVGGGNGLLAHAVKTLLRVERVASVDIGDRFLDGLGIETQTFDGATLPFADASFDCLLLCNVLHHVPTASRVALLRECRRVSKSGIVYVKDHLPVSALDHLRLTGLDLIGNIPFGGMVAAKYASQQQWLALAAAAGFCISAWEQESYRTGLLRYLFPNRLEVLMQWTNNVGA